MTQPGSSRDAGLDVVRTVAIAMVITIHSASDAVTAGTGGPNWYGALFWAVLARPAVPLFLMCSGALMLGRDIPLKRLFGHNMLRIVLSLLVWALGYQLAFMLLNQPSLDGLWIAVKNTLLFRHGFHFYYLHIMILVYAFLPVCRAYIRNASRRELEYLLVFWFVTGILFPLLRYFPPFSLMYPVEAWYMMNMAYSAAGFGVLGWYLKQYGGRVPAVWYGLSLAAGFILIFAGTAFFSLRAGMLDERFLEGMSPGPMLMALGLFGLMANREKWPAPVVRVSGRLALSAFCIYLVHLLVLGLEMKLGLDTAAAPSLIVIPLTALAVMIPSYLCWEVLRHIPVIRTWLI